MRGVLHCFTGSQQLAGKALDLGFFISLSGIVTFKNARDLQETAKIVPDDRLLVETDSPFLAPVPHRGQTCEPAFVADTARFVADLRGVEAETLAETTTAQLLHFVQQSRRMKIRILGCGTSTGVPRLGSGWGACDPDEPRNRRLRSSILVESGGETPAGRLRARPARAIAGGRASIASTASSSPTTMPTIAMASTICGRSPRRGESRCRLLARARRARAARGPLPLHLHRHPLLPGRRASRCRSRMTSLSARRRLRFVDQPHGGITSLGIRIDEGERQRRLCH